MNTRESSQIALRRQAALADGGVEYKAKRAELIRTAALVFRETGYTSATLNDIAERLGTDRATLYYYVGSKEELFHACIEGVLDENLARGLEIVKQDTSPREKLTQLVNVVLTSYEENHPYMYVYIQEDMSRIASEDALWATRMVEQTHRFERLFMDLIDEGVADGSFRQDVPTTLLANGLFGMMTWTHRWYVPGRHYSVDQLAHAFLAIFFEGIDND